MPTIEDPKLQNVFKDLMAASWDKLPEAVIYDVKTALSGSTDDKAGKEIVENVFRAAEAAEEFGDMLINLKMEIDDSIGLSGEVLDLQIYHFVFFFLPVVYNVKTSETICRM